MVSWFIARKYLSSRFITLASFLLVSLSVAILIVLLAVMEGFKTEMIERIRGTSADLKVKSTRFVGMDDHEEVRAIVDATPGVRATVPYVETMVMYKLVLPGGFSERTGHLGLTALDLAAEAEAGKVDDYIRNYNERFAHRGFPQTAAEIVSSRWITSGLWSAVGRPRPRDAAKLRPVILGAEALPRFATRDLTGFQIELTSISPVTSRPRSERFIIAGFFRSQDVQQDSESALMTLRDATDFLALENPETGATTISGFRVFVDAQADADTVKHDIERRLHEAEIPFVTVQTWEEEKARILRAVRMEKFLVGLILGVIIVFVGLMIFIIMTVQIVEKTRDLGILQSVGMTPPGIVGIYLRMGGVICTAGIALGVLVGVSFCLSIGVIQRWLFVLAGVEIFPRSVYYIDTIPVRMVASDFASVIIPTVIFSFLASLLAAGRAARTHPLDALRYE